MRILSSELRTMPATLPYPAPRRATALWLGAALALAVLTAPVMANQAIDPVTTGSVHPSPASERPGSVEASTVQPAPVAERPVVETHGSLAFQRALGLLDSDKEAAYRAARGFGDDVERRTVQWAAIYYGGGTIDYDTVLRFKADAPDFASDSLYRTRMEQALTEADNPPGHARVIELLGGSMPNTLDAQLALARAYVADGQAERAGDIVKYIWTRNFLDRDTEAEIRRDFGSLLTGDNHWARAVHLLMHDRATGTERIMDRLTPAQQSLAKARIAVSRKKGNAKALLDRVDPAYRDHPLFYFALAQQARRTGNLAHAVSYLDQVEGTPPDAAEFWYERRLIARQALAGGAFKTAYAAAAGYTHGPEGRLVDARFHAGWIAMAFLDDPATAEKHFAAMTTISTLPDSITQSHYWLGKARAAQGKTEAANAAFRTAAGHNTVYYGQLARLELGISSVGLRSLPAWQQSKQVFEERQLVQAVRLLKANDRESLAAPLVRRLAYTLTDPGELLLAARLAQTIGAHNLAILIADIADGRGVALDLFNFPKDGVPANARLAEIDKAAVYAVARQESRFDATAISHAGARGLMQLMPATAREVAQREGLAYSPGRLTADPAYNARLGSSYLATQLDRYDGSFVLAAAAYNAGAGNVNKWLKTFGDPRSSGTDAVSWIEAIPFTETRTYVKRVLGNYMVYRARMGDESLTIADALRRIPH